MKIDLFAVSLALLVTVAAVDSRAESSSAEAANAKAQARLHFEQGMKLAREGKLDAAVAAFESAYRLRPHYSVLFNLGQARAAMGRSVEAVDAFRRYLDEGGKSIEAARRANVTELIAFHEKRIGSLRLAIEPEGAEVWLDGRLIGTSPLSDPVRLVEGSHGIAVRKSGFVQAEKSVEIAAGSTTDLALRAERAVASADSQGLILVRCAVPDVDVSIDGNAVGRTASDKLVRVPVGRSELRLARSGYVTDTRSVDVSSDKPTEIVCRLEPDGRGPRGSLNVRARPADATVWVNGNRYRGDALPAGRHAVRVERSGFRTFSSLIRIEPAKTAEVAANLEPTKAQKDAWKAERSNRTTWAIATTIGGVALAGAGVATYVWNSQRYDDWLDDRRALDAELAQGPATPAWVEANQSLNKRSVSIDRVDVVAVGLGLAGAVTLGVSGALWIGLADGAGDP